MVFCVNTLSMLNIWFVVLCLCCLHVRASTTDCTQHPMHADTYYTLEAPWKRADGSDARTWDVYFDHDQYLEISKTESGTSSYFACPYLDGKETCCSYSTYMHMSDQVLQMYEMFYNETRSDLDDYTEKFSSMMNEFITAIRAALSVAGTFSDDLNLDGASVVLNYIGMFLNRLWSVEYEVTGNSATCIRNFMIYYAGLWCLSCDQETYTDYIVSGTIKLAKGSMEKITTVCGSTIVEPLASLVDDFLELVMDMVDSTTWWYSIFETARGFLNEAVTGIVSNVVGVMMSSVIVDQLNGADLGYLTKKGSGNFTLESFGPFSIGVFIYEVMAWLDTYVFGWVPSSLKSGYDFQSFDGEEISIPSLTSFLEDNPLDYVSKNPLFEDHPFAGWLTIQYNVITQYSAKYMDTEDPEIQSVIAQGKDLAVDVLGVSEIQFQSDVRETAVRVQAVKTNGAPDISLEEVEKNGFEVFAVGLNTGYFPNVSSDDLSNVSIDWNTGNNNTSSTQNSTFSGVEYLAAVAVVFMIMGSCVQGKKAAVRAAAKNMKKKKSKRAKTGMDKLLDERKRTKLSAEAKQNLIALPSTSQFDQFLEKVGGNVGKYNKVELINEDLRRPTGNASNGPPKPSESSREKLNHLNNVLDNQRTVRKVRAF